MLWADKIADEIISSGKYKPYWVDDMFTPSGYAHIGSLRGPLIHDFIYKSLISKKKVVTFTYVFNDFDPIDGLPPNLQTNFSKYLGFPLRTAPSPESGYESFGAYFAEDFKKVLRSLGVTPKFLSSWEMYNAGKFDGVIKDALNNAEEIQDIYEKISGSQKREKGWFPFQVICQKCGKLGTTRVYAWDGSEVSYKCEPSMVSWAQGCGHEGKISPFGGAGKLPWKVDWSAHWKVIGVTIEGAGKDHASAGGSYDITMEVCRKVFKYNQPFKFPYEFFLIGGKKMASSKGLGLRARDWIEMVPPEIGRFLFVRTNYQEALEFNPLKTMAIPDLFDEYDRAAESYWDKKADDLGGTFELSQPKGKPPDKIFLPRFREVAQVIQAGKVGAKKYFSDKKGSSLAKEESKILDERIKYAKIWLKDYAPADLKFEITQEVSAKAHITLSLAFWKELIEVTNSAKSPEELEKSLYKLIKKSGRKSKVTFQEIYNLLIGKPFGPKLAWLIWENKKKAIEIFKEVSRK